MALSNVRLPALAMALGLALLVGFAAVLLVGSAPAAPPARDGSLLISLPAEVWGLLLLCPILLGLASLLFRRGSGPSLGVSPAPLVILLIVGILFTYLLVHGIAGSGSVSYVAPGTPTNTSQPTNNSTPTNNSSHPGNASTPGGGSTLHLPPWTLEVIVAATAGIVAVLAMPGVLSWIVDRRARGPAVAAAPPAPAAIGAALEAAGRALDRGEDPRTTIVSLYLRLLGALGPRVGDLGPMTAQEIHLASLARFGVTPAASEAIARLFEEARYSSHPLGPEAAARCREAIRAIERDLAGSAA
jgi:hypothetical protein